MVAVDRLIQAHKAFAANGASAAPAWLKALRDGGIARFGALGFPTTKQQAWRFTSVAAIAETAFELSPRVSGAGYRVSGELAVHRLVFVNGHFSAEQSRVKDLPQGVRVESLARALVTDAPSVEAHLGKYAPTQDHPFAALNTAFLEDG